MDLFMEEETSLISPICSQKKKYGTTSNFSTQKDHYVTYHVKDGDTLQGIALKFDVSVEKLKRANRLWTNDSICLRRTLLIPATFASSSSSSSSSSASSPCSHSSPSSSSSSSSSATPVVSDSCDSLSSVSCTSYGGADGGSESASSAVPPPVDRSSLSMMEFLDGIDRSIARSRHSVRQLSSKNSWNSEAVAYARSTWERFDEPYDETYV